MRLHTIYTIDVFAFYTHCFATERVVLFVTKRVVSFATKRVVSFVTKQDVSFVTKHDVSSALDRLPGPLSMLVQHANSSHFAKKHGTRQSPGVMRHKLFHSSVNFRRTNRKYNNQSPGGTSWQL